MPVKSAKFFYVMSTDFFVHDNSQENEPLRNASLDSLLSVETVRKWKRKDVLDFLQKKIEDLDIEPNNIKVIENNRVAGDAFLKLTAKCLLVILTTFLAGWLEP
ncbi:hypothetical protein RclHR1_05180005 [Rhizophagus clarus]|uniref:Uncharacterized protein n=1 Tax=Rhizophagus clarus TaxID=94130 RepID=A0A2Z6RKU2_9GLOM|nr:hypothetical protein RclHR1_05180005 [Rhizophagus clarus]